MSIHLTSAKILLYIVLDTYVYSLEERINMMRLHTGRCFSFYFLS